MKRMCLKNLILSLYALLVVCMGISTLLEKQYGTTYVSQHIYGSWWFIALWALLTVASLRFLVLKKVHKRLAVFLLHFSFVLMLAGALITHFTSVSGTLHLRVEQGASSFVDSESRVRELPFLLTLTNFETVSYPGTDAVMDYRCRVEVKQEGSRDSMQISMNHIGQVAGYRFYQSAYDSDHQGTQLLVAHDPYGIALTYTGYVLLFISFLWILFSRHTRIRKLYHLATRPLLLVLCSSIAVSAQAAEPTPVSSEIAREFGHMVVLYNGRLCPVNTVANEFVTKLCGKSSWNGYSADEIFLGWMIYYTQWEEQKLIRIKQAEVQQLLGLEDEWASVRDFYTASNTYKLSGKVSDPTLSASQQKAIREADEKLQVVSMFYGSELLRLFPLASEGKLQWHAPGSTELPLDIPAAEFQFINHAMDHFVKCTLVNDVDGAREILAKIRLYQKEKAGSVLPSARRVKLEVCYNALQSARWVVFLCLTLCLLFCVLQLAGRQGRWVRVFQQFYILGQSVYLSVLLVLRWLISGHVPMSNGFETMLFMAWVSLVITLLVMRKVAIMKAFGPLVSSLCMLVSMLAVGSPQITNLMPVLQSPLLSSHVAFIMLSYALLALITLVAIQSLVLARNGNVRELERQTALSQLLLYPALFTLSVGIFIGAVWANVSWGTYWSWDPKETWALITLMIYAVPLHASFMPASPVKYHAYILLAFLAVLMTYFGVNYFLSGMHSYA